MVIGLHCNKKEMIKYYQKLNIDVFQIFANSPISYKLNADTYDYNFLNDFSKITTKVKIFIHSPYIINFCSKQDLQGQKVLIELLKVSDQINIRGNNKVICHGVVIHLGKNTKGYTNKECLDNFIENVLIVLKQVPGNSTILLETSCKSANDVFWNINNFSVLYSKLSKLTKRVKVCIDTCHIFVSGYDIRTGFKKNYIDLLHKNVISAIKLVHLNDSKTPLNLGADRHEIVGKGHIFKNNEKALKDVLKYCRENNIACLTEVPSSVGELKYIEKVNKGKSVRFKL